MTGERYGGRRRQQENTVPPEIQKLIRTAKVVGVIFVALIVLLGAFYTIPAGHRGVLLTFGKPTGGEVGEGLHFKFPLVQSIKKLDVRTQKYETGASSSSRDLQIVSTDIAVNFHLAPESTVPLYRNIGIQYQAKIIQPTVQEVVKATTAKFTAEQLITKRPEVKDQILLFMRERLTPRGLVVEDISITNFEFSEAFDAAIEAKVTAEQLKLKAENDLERIEVEALQAIARAQAEAEALRLQKLQVTPNLIKLRQIEVQREAIQKWNGKLPLITGGGTLPLIEFNLEGNISR